MRTAEQKRRELVAEGLSGIAEARAWLNISNAAIYRMMAAGELPYVKIRGRRLIPRRALVDLAAANLRGGGLDG